MDQTIATNILISGAAGMLIAAFILAWLATMTRLVPVAAVQGVVKDYGAILRAHIDYLLMALFCIAFSEMPLVLPKAACLLVVVGGFANPSLFVIRGLRPDASTFGAVRFYRVTSFLVSTVGFMWVVECMLRSTLFK